MRIMNFERYKDNLRLVDFEGATYVQSYATFVAKIEDTKLVQLGWWSKTTQKHINYAAKELGLQLVRA